MRKYTKTLKVPREWALEFEKIAKKEDPLKSWSDKARQILKFYLDNRRAGVPK